MGSLMISTDMLGLQLTINLGGSAGTLAGVCDVRRIWTDCRKRSKKVDDVQYGETKFCEIINYKTVEWATTSQ